MLIDIYSIKSSLKVALVILKVRASSVGVNIKQDSFILPVVQQEDVRRLHLITIGSNLTYEIQLSISG